MNRNTLQSLINGLYHAEYNTALQLASSYATIPPSKYSAWNYPKHSKQ